ncbi:hypothetical protein [Pseudonocardia sp. GCM10023141]|uniref:hypothetical protein n=1 Tax=Pseudonocardia sp. GCM10023141 TaxID=3252653 RepID=UPI0036190306
MVAEWAECRQLARNPFRHAEMSFITAGKNRTMLLPESDETRHAGMAAARPTRIAMEIAISADTE